MSESTLVINHINNLNMLFAQLIMLDFNIVENECSLPNLYDQIIINITNNIIVVHLPFDDVVGAILKEDSKRKNKKDRLEILKQSKGERKINGHMALVAVKIMNEESQMLQLWHEMTLKEILLA
ncbi:hypothetical protein CR513_39031, partial [Mucuna pruriens]